MFTATYSPDDNKLRLYAESRLDSELYARVKAAGFAWAPKQELFVAPMWTPAREDLLTELAGEIDDEDTSLVDRQAERAERFEDYSDRREADAHRARANVDAITSGIPLGQPILVGHHSERHARKHAEQIENGIRKAVNMWETSKYWTARAAGALRHAKYKQLPAVRARRIKTIEADMRKQERAKVQAQQMLLLWTAPALTLESARFMCGRTEAGYLPMVKQEDSYGYWHAFDVLRPDGERYRACPARTLEECVETAREFYPANIAHYDRWINHYLNRLAYEKAMLDEQGASDLLKPKARAALLPICNYRQESFQIENQYNRGSMETYRQVELTAAQYAKIYTDYKGTRVIENSHRVRIAVMFGAGYKQYGEHVAVFISDSKVHPKPEAQETAPKTPRTVPTYTPREPKAPNAFDAMKKTLKVGVQVVSAPQLFSTPPELAAKVIEAADIEAGMTVLEPSAGTGNLVRAVIDAVDTEIVGYEIDYNLVSHLGRTFPSYKLCARRADFLEVTEGMGQFPRIVMNPPFANGADIAHIRHAVKFLRPGGRLVAICANGPRQRAVLMPLAEESGGYWEDLPAGSFATSGTGVNTAMVVIEG